MKRIRESFDFNWMFYKGDLEIGYAIKAGCTGSFTALDKNKDGEWTQIAYSDKEAVIDIDEKRWTKVSIPHDFIVGGDFSRGEWDAQGFLPTGVGCYRKVFRVEEDLFGKKISLEFEGVSRNCTIWLNGHLVLNHFSGYTGFWLDMTDFLNYGGENVIFIKVDAREFEGWWYEGAGIYRHVWYTVTDRVHVGRWGTYVTTPQISETHADVRIEAQIENETAHEEASVLETVIYDENGGIVASGETSVVIAPQGKTVTVQNLRVPKPMLWDIDSPCLYIAKSTIKGHDTYETAFGIRKIEFTKEGFFLNGRHVLIKGTCNHQDFAGVGSALPDSINEYKIKKLLEMGSNAYRSSHHPATPALLDACDRLGMLVMDENRKLDSSERGLADIDSLILRDRNHPSIIMWCLDNEESILGTKVGKQIETTLRDRVHSLDSTRPTTVAMNHGWNENGYEECMDIMGYNYGQRGEQYIKDMAEYPDRMMICTESTSSTTTRGIYKDDTERGYCTSYETNLASWCCTHEKSWLDLIKHPRLTGIFVWTGFDYRGEPTPYSWPCVNSHFGIMDTCGLPKDAYYYYKSVWTDKPMVHFMPHWDLKRNGEKVNVRIFSNSETIELKLNGKSLGERAMVKNAHLDWEVEYEEGEIEAIGKNGGVQVCAFSRMTSGAPYKVELCCEREDISFDGRDTVVVRACVTDVRGNVVPFASNEIEFSASGGRIIGVGNGDPADHSSDKSRFRRAFNGYCVALVQATGETDSLTICAASKGLEDASICLKKK
ncbi:MAG: beta-galactosidase GalA [Clostridia bacterium]|nr:beta-galactosidase GalA [Clostridia bacterium]